MHTPRARFAAAAAVVVVLLCGTPPRRAEAAGKKNAEYLSPPDIIKVAEKSKTNYKIAPLAELQGADRDHLEEVLWAAGPEPPTFPWVVEGENSSRHVQPYRFDDGCTAILKDAEPLFSSKQYAAAVEKYLEATSRFPTCYLAISDVGDCHFFSGRFEAAIEWYDKALAVNPFDYRTYFYKGNALFRLGRSEEAHSYYSRALSLHPRSGVVKKVVEDNAAKLGFDYVERLFTPRSVARPDSNGGVTVYFDPETKPYWLVYGLCKAIWIGEPEHRKVRLGTTDHGWSSTEEQQCLLSLLESYSAHRGDQSVSVDPEMERLLKIAEEGMLLQLVLYEMASRAAPSYLLMLSQDDQSKIQEFVQRFVLPAQRSVTVQRQPATTPDAE